MVSTTLPKERVKQLRRQVAKDVAGRVQAALLATMGTSRAPSRKRIAEGIRDCMKWAHHKDYVDQDYFHWDQMLIHIERGQGPIGDTFTVYVPATSGHFWAQKDMGRQNRQSLGERKKDG